MMTRKPNVLLMIDSFDMGGAESQAVLLARLLLEDGRYGVHLACLHRRGALLSDATRLGLGEIPEFPLTSFYNLNAFVQLRRFISFLRKHQIDVIHPQSFYTNVFAITAAALAGVRVRIAFRGETYGWRTPLQNFVERCSYRIASAVHANSNAVKDYLINHGLSEHKVVTVYNGLDMGRVAVRPGATRKEVIAEFGLPTGEYQVVTMVANLRHPVKDHPMFLRAARQVFESEPNTVFVLAGEGELTEEMQKLAAELGISEKTFFIGHCNNPGDLLFISDVCVLSSKAEGFSNVILEYMAGGKPVVVTDVGGAREAVVHGQTGYLVPSGDDAQMAAYIIQLLRNPEAAKLMGGRGRERVIEMFSDQAQLRNTTAMYEKLLRESARSESRSFKHTGTEAS